MTSDQVAFTRDGFSGLLTTKQAAIVAVRRAAGNVVPVAELARVPAASLQSLATSATGGISAAARLTEMVSIYCMIACSYFARAFRQSWRQTLHCICDNLAMSLSPWGGPAAPPAAGKHLHGRERG